jgi:hypothetical protein
MANYGMPAIVFRQLSMWSESCSRLVKAIFIMIDSLLNTLLFCAHRRTTFPMTMTMSRQPHASSTLPIGKRTYVICLDCGKEFSYNWKEMRIVAAEPIADWGIRRIGASWFASAHALLGNRGIAANFSLLRRNACGSVNSLLIGLWSAVQAGARVCGRLLAFSVFSTRVPTVICNSTIKSLKSLTQSSKV